MFYRLEKDENGNYTKDGQRYSLFGCNVCESKQFVDNGDNIEEKVVVNDGFVEFETEETAAQHFGLTYEPIEEGE